MRLFPARKQTVPLHLTCDIETVGPFKRSASERLKELGGAATDPIAVEKWGEVRAGSDAGATPLKNGGKKSSARSVRVNGPIAHSYVESRKYT